MALRSALRNYLANNDRVYRWCRSIVNRRHGENNSDMHTNGELHLLRRILPQCQTVFDVGANVGNWTRLALRINPNLEMHCFEPAKPTYDALRANHFPARVKCHNVACGAQASREQLYVSDNCGSNSMYQRKGLEGYGLATPQETEGIEVIAVDDYCETHGIASIDFVKIDVEGFELQVIQGMKRMLSNQRVGAIQFEYGGTFIDARVFLHDIFSIFAGRPYSFHKIYPTHLQHYPRYDQRLETMQYQNWLIIRDGFVIRK